MKNLWNKDDARKFEHSSLDLRVYSSRLLGQEPDLVLHGGGNTSVKVQEKDLFGEQESILYVKGSGWDLATIEKEGFAPVRMEMLLKMARLDVLSDTDMVKYQRAAMTNPYAPNPSIEAILHAIIPFTYVDHTHADAVVTITNTPRGRERIKEIYGDRVLIVDYVMPGFILARHIYDLTKDLDWNSIEGMILLNHGVFTFDHNAKSSYDKMIALVSEAEDYLERKGVVLKNSEIKNVMPLIELASIRKGVSALRGAPVLAQPDNSEASLTYSNLPHIEDIASRGPVTPDHTIRTKCLPAVLLPAPGDGLRKFAANYRQYFQQFSNETMTMLDPAPRWAVWPGYGTLIFGTSLKETAVIKDISQHTMKAIRQAEMLERWQALPQKDLFEMEYWELEQAKLKKAGNAPPMQGKIALVTGAASGIGKACVERLAADGATVAAVDINPVISSLFNRKEVLGIECDVTREESLKGAIEQTVGRFGGLDMLVSNAGIFPQSALIADMDPELWDRSININLKSHRQLLSLCLPYLELGIDPAVVVIGSKNVPAPGPGASAYSVAKAGLTQLARIAALEWGSKGIRVNVIHPNAVYDTGIWTKEVLEARAANYGLSVAEYKTDNILKTEVTSRDVAELVCLMLGAAFSKVTGAQIPVDGGNVRII